MLIDMRGIDQAYWLADKIPAYGDYAKEAANVLRRQAYELERLHKENEKLRRVGVAMNWKPPSITTRTAEYLRKIGHLSDADKLEYFDNIVGAAFRKGYNVRKGDELKMRGEKEQQMQQMQQMQVKCIMIDGENAIISADQFDWLCAQAEKVKNLEKVAEAASAEFNAEIARLTDALRMAADEPNIDKARKIADAALTPNVEVSGRPHHETNKER